jgi:hypothetical protein
VGVRTVQALDATRDGRPLIFEAWYAGQEFAELSRDIYRMLPSLPLVWQAAVCDAASRLGSYPLLALSRSSWEHRRQSTFLCTHVAGHGCMVQPPGWLRRSRPLGSFVQGSTPTDVCVGSDLPTWMRF